ncbi:MAG: FHIPEP family type III secretion protein [bacterium]
MFDKGRREYLVRTCPADDPDVLENLLNSYAIADWELYMLHETEGKNGTLQYNCIFNREAVEEKELEDKELIDVSNFKTRMEKSLLPSKDAYGLCVDIQQQIIQQQNEIDKIKERFDSSSITDDEREELNEQISLKLEDVEDLKAALTQIIGPEPAYERISQEKITLIVSEELTDIVDINKDGSLISESVNLRQKLTDKYGYVLPTIRFTNLEAIEANEFRIDIRGIKAFSGYVYPGFIRLFAGQANIIRKPKNAIEDIDPITGKKVFWIEESKTKTFWEKGKTTTDVIIEALEYCLLKHVDLVLDYSDINRYIEIAGTENLFLVENIITEALTISDLRSIFASLIREKVSIKDIIFVFEKFNDVINEGNTKEEFLEKLRIKLKRQICNSIADTNGTINAVLLAEDCEELLSEILANETYEGSYKMVANSKVEKIIKSVIDIIKSGNYDLSSFAFIVPAGIRKSLFLLLNEVVPSINVIAYEEMDKTYNFEIVGRIKC